MRLTLVLIPLVGAVASLYFGLPYIATIFLIYLLPGIYVDVLKKRRTDFGWHFLYAAIIGLPFAIVVDYFGIKSGLWYVPSSVFQWRLLGCIPVEDVLWMIAAVFTIISLRHFDSSEAETRPNRQTFRNYLIAVGTLLLAFFVCTHVFPNAFDVRTPWAYSIIGSVFFGIPATIWICQHYSEIPKILPVVIFFLFCTVLFELVAVHLHDWEFEGQYLIPMLNLYGVGPIPYEELFFVGLVGPVAGIAIHDMLNHESTPEDIRPDQFR